MVLLVELLPEVIPGEGEMLRVETGVESERKVIPKRGSQGKE